jgi:hypothetical protein
MLKGFLSSEESKKFNDNLQKSKDERNAKIKTDIVNLQFIDFVKRKSGRTVDILIDLTNRQFVMKIFEYLGFAV